MPKKSHFTIFVIQNFVQNTKNTHEFHFCCWDHVCKVNEWCLIDCFYHEFKVSTQIMVHDHCIEMQETQKVFPLWLAFDGPLGHFFSQFNI